MTAFENFEEIFNLKLNEDKQRAWLKQYEGKKFSIGEEGKDLIFWKKEEDKYVYYDSRFNESITTIKGDNLFLSRINKIQRHDRIFVIEFDDHLKGTKLKDKEKIKDNIQSVKTILEKYNIGYIESSHDGNSNYIWIEYNRNLKDKEIEEIIKIIAPINSEVDTNFASSNKRFPVLFAPHWKYNIREFPINFFKGEKLNDEIISKIALEKKPNKTINESNDGYKTSKIESVPDKKVNLGEMYELIIQILKKYCDLEERYYSLIAIWIIGTYMHKGFPTYPYLFFNAMKGSGKSRLLRLITVLSKEGCMLNSLTEAVLFRTKGMLGIDEFEGLNRKGKENLTELLNSAYKRGTKVKRMKKVHTIDGEEQVVEEFDVYRPIALANISGMDNVLNDRCITIILNKSNNPKITKMMEIYEEDLEIKKLHSLTSVSLVDVDNLSIYNIWNIFINSLQNPSSTHVNVVDVDKCTPERIEQNSLNSIFSMLYLTIFH